MIEKFFGTGGVKVKVDILIIGGVAAGTSAGAAAKRRDNSLDILLVQKEKYISYGGCGLPYYVEGIIDTIDKVMEFTPEKFKEKKGVDVMSLHEVYKVDFDRKVAKIRSLESGEKFEVEYGKLIISTGASAIVPKIEGVEDDRIFTIRNPEDAMKIRSFIEEKKPERAVIVGGGYIGVEMAEAIASHGVKVTIVEALGNLLTNAEPEINEVILEGLKKNGVEVLLNTTVQKLIPEERVKVVTTNGEIDADFVLMAVGVKPNTEIFNLEKGIKGAIKVDSLGKTSAQDVYAAGDCATAKHIITGKDVYIPLGTTANKQGRVAGRVAAGGIDRFAGVVGASVTKIFDVEFARAGLTKNEAIKEGFDAEAIYIKSRSRAGYYPGAGPVHIKLVFDKKTGRILGAQVAGKEVHRRLDVIVAAIYGRLTVMDLGYMDLSYAPPFSPVWDPILIAGNVARRKI